MFIPSLIIPTYSWESVSMEFVRGLPTTGKGCEYLVDKISNMCVLMTCKKKIKRKKVGNLSFQQVWPCILGEQGSSFVIGHQNY